MGVPSVFLRTFGCNFTCSGFGMPRGELSVERDNVEERIAEFKDYRELPLVSTGCDSYASWDPRFKHLSPMVEIDGLSQRIVDLLPYKKWQDEHLVITGGEPLLGWQRNYPDLLEHPLMQSVKELTFETNGTQSLTPEFKNYLRSWNQKRFPHGRGELTFSVSPKLSASGESWSDAIKPKVVCEYQEIGYTYLKFVVATQEDVDDALMALGKFKDEGFRGPCYLMAEGGVEEKHQLNKRRVAELAMKHGLRYSARLQVDLFKNGWGT